VFLLEASVLIRRASKERMHDTEPHIVVTLMGRFKGETGERNLMLCLVNVTASGIQVRR